MADTTEVALRTDAGAAGDEAAGTVFVDISDLLGYLQHHSAVSGIQRVIVEVLPGLMERNSCQLVVLSRHRREFVFADREAFASLLRLLREVGDADGHRVNEAARALLETPIGARTVDGRPGDSLAVLGAAWMYDELFSAVARLRLQEVAVVVLIHDLIPVVFPGFPENVIATFRQYLAGVAFLADRVPGNSAATRGDFEAYCSERNWETTPGGVTHLAADQWDLATGGDHELVERAWPRPFALLVATIEERKNHVLALRAWRRLIEEHGADAIPDLVCVGRLGWNCMDFLDEFTATNGLDGKITLLTNQLSDQRLAALYRDCEFTVYPSRYEGWGLPVTESLMAGKPCITAMNSSLPEAGGEFATYFADNDVDGLVAAVKQILQPGVLEAEGARIRERYDPPRWDDIADVLSAELRAAVQDRRSFRPRMELDTEYGLGRISPYGGDYDGGRYLAYLDTQRRLPLTQQIQDPMRVLIGDLVVQGTAEPSGPEGRPLPPGSALRLTFPRPAGGTLHFVAVFGHHTPGDGVRVTGPLGAQDVQLPPGGACSIPLGSGAAEDLVELTIECTTRSPVVLVSCCLLDSELQAKILVERRTGWAIASLDTLADKRIQDMRNSLSWRITHPLRRGRDLAAKYKQTRFGR